jgi:hypothetical protein
VRHAPLLASSVTATFDSLANTYFPTLRRAIALRRGGGGGDLSRMGSYVVKRWPFAWPSWTLNYFQVQKTWRTWMNSCIYCLGLLMPNLLKCLLLFPSFFIFLISTHFNHVELNHMIAFFITILLIT